MKRILLIGLTLFSLSVFGQKNVSKKYLGPYRKEIGLRTMYGVQNEVLRENVVYKPILITPYMVYYLNRADKRFRFGPFVEASFAPVIEKSLDKNKSNSMDWEVGFNIGPSITYRLKWFTPYIGASYGADYVTVKTKQQANGLIFCATSYIGIKREIKNNYYADLHFRLRHISNGDMKLPNYGIDSKFLGLGISKIF